MAWHEEQAALVFLKTALPPRTSPAWREDINCSHRAPCPPVLKADGSAARGAKRTAAETSARTPTLESAAMNSSGGFLGRRRARAVKTAARNCSPSPVVRMLVTPAVHLAGASLTSA